MNSRANQTYLNNSSSKYYYFFFICYLAALGAFPSLVNDLYLPTLPQMRAEFHTTRSITQLGLSFVMLGLGLGELIWGPISDKIGRKPILYISLVVFTITSAISIFSPTIYFFIICRLFQGFGASGAVLLARTIPADECQGLQLAKIMALIGAINGIAPVSGPLLGGLMATSIGWRGIFTVLTAIGIIMLITALKLQESLPEDRRLKGPIKKAFKEFIPLLHNRPFMVHVMLKGASLGVLFSYISAGPFIIQERYGLTPLYFGLLFGLNALAIVLGSLICVKFHTMKKAAVTGAAGMVFFALADGITILIIDNIYVFEGFVIPMLFFSGLVFASANTLAMTEGHVAGGSASAILGLAGYIFGVIVSPLVGMGHIMISTSISIICCALISLYYAWQSYHLPALKIQP